MSVLSPQISGSICTFNPQRTRADIQIAARGLLSPPLQRLSHGRARLRLGPNSAHFPDIAAEVEGFCRMLWGLVPLVAGGGRHDATELLLEGLINGTDPQHPEYWGVPKDFDHRLIDSAAIGYALCLARQHFWEPLKQIQRDNLVNWLGLINTRKLPDNNWRFSRVLVNLGIRSIGATYDETRMQEDLHRLASFYAGDGWYGDGPGGPKDYYNSFVMHFYSMVYVSLAGPDDAHFARLFRVRAKEFAVEFVHWFSPDGSSVPFGRSLTYRFGQAAFWSGLALAGVEALPWGVVKGLVLRSLRWWLHQPICDENGLLTVGYSYPNQMIAEQYVSPATPYWALKSLAMLAISESHPFWQSAEEPLPELPKTKAQKQPGLIVCRCNDHVYALAGGQKAPARPRHFAEKYSKFCYSNRCGFSLPSSPSGVEFVAPDSTLLLGENREWLRGRQDSEYLEVHPGYILSVWRPWPSIVVTTWLVPAGPWHVRAHRLATDRPLESLEGGFAIDRDGGEDSIPHTVVQALPYARVSCGSATSIIRDLSQARVGVLVRAAPNTNLLWPRTAIPALAMRHPAGEHWFGCAVAVGPDEWIAAAPAPACQFGPTEIVVTLSTGEEICRIPIKISS